jgi:hypothetical protein
VSVCSVAAFASFLAIAGCGRSAPEANQSVESNTLYSSPPFSTKEPDRYQATRLVTFSEIAPDNSVNELHTARVLIMRDADQRREEYEAGKLGNLVILENARGRYMLLPQLKLYADANEANTSSAADRLNVETELTSPDLLLHESNSAVQYQKFGEEVVAGRKATKYKVESSASRNTETFIWIDERLGMPIAMQSTSPGANGSTRAWMELQDIRTEVDPRIFALPADYRKVPMKDLLGMIRSENAQTEDSQ